MTHSRAAELLQNAKRLIMEATRAAEAEGLPQSFVNQIDALAGKTEGLQVRVQVHANKP